VEPHDDQVRESEFASELSPHAAAVHRALAFILNDSNARARLRDIAMVAGFSQHHFNRIFSDQVGESVMELFRRVYLERAAYRLRHSRVTVSEVAYDAGYDSYEAFSRTFRAAFGMAPSAYRRKSGVPHIVLSTSDIHWSPGGGIGALSPHRSGEKAIEFAIVTSQPIRAAAWRHVGPFYSIHETWERLQSFLVERGWTESRSFSVFLNSPSDNPPEKLETDVCFAVPDGFQRESGLHLLDIPAGDYVSFTHEGVDADLGDAWSKLFTEWLPASGRECAGPCFEEYVGGWSPQLGSVRTRVFVGLR
jgi:AraC family transcriptional regulator